MSVTPISVSARSISSTPGSRCRWLSLTELNTLNAGLSAAFSSSAGALL